jgi:hypothetical protein
MQPAERDVVHLTTRPASTATTGERLAAMRSLPWWRPCQRGAPKSFV